MSQERSSRVGKPKSAGLDFKKIKVFDKPEFQLPYHLAALTGGPRGRASVPPPGWLLAAVESGLVEMVSPSADGLKDGLLKPIGKKRRHPAQRMKPGELERVLREGIENTLRQMNQPKTEPGDG